MLFRSRELFHHGRWDEAIHELERYLNMSNAPIPERAFAMRLLGKSYLNKNDFKKSHKWFLKATEEESGRREGWIDLAKLLFHQNDFVACIDAIRNGLKDKNINTDWIYDNDCWGATPYDLAAQCFFHTNDFDQAAKFGLKAVKMDSNNKRLKDNLKFYKSLCIKS